MMGKNDLTATFGAYVLAASRAKCNEQIEIDIAGII